MNKCLIIVLFLLCVNSLCFTQATDKSSVANSTLESKPDSTTKKGPIVIKHSVFKDSLKVGGKVELNLEYPLCDTIHPVKLLDVKLRYVQARDLSSEIKYTIHSFNDKNLWTEEHIYLWDYFSELLTVEWFDDTKLKMLYSEYPGQKTFFWLLGVLAYPKEE